MVWVDGRMEPVASRHLSAFDRGFQLGDAVFETVRAHAGVPVELPAHLARLAASALALEIALPPDVATLVGEAIAGLLAVDGLDAPGRDAAVRITASRGAMRSRSLLPDRSAPSTLVVQAWAAEPPSAGLLARGLRLAISSVRHDPRNPLAGAKTTSRADHVFARLEAARAGADDALFLTFDGHLAEASSATLFLLRGHEVATPALDCGILAGTTRDWVLRWAAEVGLRPFEGWLTVEDAVTADEAFLGSSVAGILPATWLGDRPIGGGDPGPWTMRSRAAREAFVKDQARRQGAAPDP
jgi:branched-chain amino acid aminotransferase